MTELDPALTRPELSCRLVAAFLPQAEEEFGSSAVRKILDDAGLPERFVRNPRNWVSVDYVNRIVAGIARHGYGLDDVPADYDAPLWTFWYRNGRRALDPQSFGVLFSVLRALGTPAAVLRNLPAMARSGNPLIQVDVEELEDHFVIEVGYGSLGMEPAGVCWNLRGILEGIPLVWGLPPAAVEHSSCVSRDGSPRCVYHVPRAAPVRFRFGALALALGLGAGAGVGVAAAMGASVAVPAFAGAGWGLTVLLASRQGELVAAAARDGLRSLDLLRSADQRAADLWQEGQLLRRSLMASKKLSGYLAADLVEHILDNPEEEVSLGGRRTQTAVLFADIVGFTPRSEGRDPADVVDELNLYFSHVDPALSARGGVVDKRIGDGIMAVFPSQEHMDPPGKRAVDAGLAMQAAMVALNAIVVAQGNPPLAIRIGVAAGPLVQGNMGSPVRLEYTVIGDTVNAAARLEGQAAPGHVLVLRSSLESLDGYVVADRRTITVKGKAEPLEVVELAGLA